MVRRSPGDVLWRVVCGAALMITAVCFALAGSCFALVGIIGFRRIAIENLFVLLIAAAAIAFAFYLARLAIRLWK
ncbi:MAG TPA: hypothetical protein VK934_07590 [Fimbriimonas sp.]|nr:hypothetical protein [Fimbriimonas sp.]